MEQGIPSPKKMAQKKNQREIWKFSETNENKKHNIPKFMESSQNNAKKEMNSCKCLCLKRSGKILNQ